MRMSGGLLSLLLQDGEQPLRPDEDLGEEREECDPDDGADVDAGHRRDEAAGRLEDGLGGPRGDVPRQHVEVVPDAG